MVRPGAELPLNAAARSDPGKVRERNEDRWTARRTRGVTLLAVADGVGGAAGGDIASAAAIDALATRFYATLAGLGPRAALAAAIRDANDAVLRASAERDLGAASTLVAAAVRGREATIANLGDSRAYLVRRGAARRITTDHTGERTHEITRYVGDERGVQPDVYVEALRPGDRLVLCSDGLTRHVSDPEIARLTRAAPAAAADALVALANERGGEDNVTVVVYRAGAGRLRAVLVAVLLLLLAVTALAWAIAPPALP